MPLSNENQITIEKTPKYFIDPQVPKRVYNMNKKIKLVIVLRNPVTRAISDYTQSLEKSSVYNNSSINKFENMLFDSNGEIRTNWPIVRNGLYYIHLRNWLKYFPLNQIHFVNGEELIKNPFNEIKKVEEFYKESDKFSKSSIKEEKIDSFIVGILTDDENFNDLCINLFDKYEQRAVDCIIKCLKEFLEKLKNLLTPSL